MLVRGVLGILEFIILFFKDATAGIAVVINNKQTYI